MWQEQNNKLVKELTFKDFKEAWAFLNKVAVLAEEHNHHPEIENVYNRVTLKLCTHDAGNSITEKDRRLAKAIDEVV
jgi:4a-hydroxytetrahydrobiopterin dehydratase